MRRFTPKRDDLFYAKTLEDRLLVVDMRPGPPLISRLFGRRAYRRLFHSFGSEWLADRAAEQGDSRFSRQGDR